MEKVRVVFFCDKVDAFLMPNIPVEGDMEGFGLVCLEASACGTLVFAADIDGIPDAVRNGKNGFLLPPACRIRREYRPLAANGYRLGMKKK
ncbi:MAG: glycosyltransferase [Tannerella sp.]|jgi:glycosyltransferase involved in cell wall biosynthesis|nr:glycosyltransferase [Tannerella sp.]